MVLKPACPWGVCMLRINAMIEASTSLRSSGQYVSIGTGCRAARRPPTDQDTGGDTRTTSRMISTACSDLAHLVRAEHHSHSGHPVRLAA